MDKNILSLEDKVALVTGARRGIGRAMAFAFAEAGADVAICDCVTDDGMLDQVALQINNHGRDFLAVCADTSKKADVDAMMAKVLERFGKIDILVNNAGIILRGPILDVPESDWDSVMNVDLKGYFLCAQAAGRHMMARGSGSIINLSSIYGMVGGIDDPPPYIYHAAKGAVRMMTKSDAICYARDKIRVNSVHPGWIYTPLLEEVGLRFGNPQEFNKQLQKHIPLGHFGEPDDVAYGVLYLASDESKFVTGSELVIDGGYIAW